jgi:transcriptional regulator with XRE-family HTH domain
MQITEVVRRRMDSEGWSTYDVARQSGDEITHATVWSIKEGRVKSIKIQTLHSLAKGLKIPVSELIGLAEGKDDGPDASEQRLLFYFRELPPEQKRDLVAMAAAMRHRRELSPQPAAEDLDVIHPTNAEIEEKLQPTNAEREALHLDTPKRVKQQKLKPVDHTDSQWLNDDEHSRDLDGPKKIPRKSSRKAQDELTIQRTIEDYKRKDREGKQGGG